MLYAHWHNHPRLRHTADVIQAGGVIAYPTEGVWGLGCDPTDVDALLRILSIKSRPIEKGVILIAAHAGQLQPYLQPLDGQQLAKLQSRQLRPTTWVCPARPGFEWLTGGRDTLAVRVSRHPVVRALCLRSEMAIVSTSANRSGKPAANTAVQVRHSLGKTVDMICPGQTGRHTQASEIRDLLNDRVYRA